MTKFLCDMNAIVWGAPALLLILGIGLYLSVQLGFPQLRLLPHALGTFFKKLLPDPEGKDASSFQALCTALGATVGTGNLVGVAGAICIGGPGAVFWMWLCGLVGMATKYAEAVLAVRYRKEDKVGYLSGPMYVITEGMGQRFRPLAVSYCVFGLVAAFGVGSGTQINAVVSGIEGVLMQRGSGLSIQEKMIVGILLAILTAHLLFGGARKIAAAAEKLVPFAAAGYIFLCIGVLLLRRENIGSAFAQILTGAFDPKAVTGGALGSAFQALRIGCSRGVFTNEAGMGTAAIAHGTAKVDHAAQQGLMGIVEVFVDTEVICTLTALVILVSGVHVPYGMDAGATLTMDAFVSVFGPWAAIAITAMLSCFAMATVLGWGLYGARCAQFLFGNGAWKFFAAVQTVSVALSALVEAASVWQFAELVNGLMVIPNLISLAALSKEVRCLTKEYMKIRQKDAGGGTYADFNQRKPL